MDCFLRDRSRLSFFTQKYSSREETRELYIFLLILHLPDMRIGISRRYRDNVFLVLQA